MLTIFLATVEKRDGWEPDEVLHLCFDPETKLTYEVAIWGFHRSTLPPCECEREALWYLVNNPSMREYHVIKFNTNIM